MVLMNLMEDNQLDFNQPLLSVRRFAAVVSTTEDKSKGKPDNTRTGLPPLPVYRSELKSGPVRNPGTVPFVWEQTPGKPKNESKTLQNHAIKREPFAPKLPPGRILNAKEQASDKHFHGRVSSQSQSANDMSSSQKAESLNKYAIQEESSKQGEGKAGSSGSEGCDEIYVDALDTLSRSESFLNCSMNSVNGVDGPNQESSRTFSTDPHTRDFMMDRFLPAAKAMASETPQYHHTRKLPVAREQPKPRKVASVVKQHPVSNTYSSNNIPPHYAQVDGAEEVSDDEDDDYEGPYKSSFSVCGLFPRLCPDNSLGLYLNPVPGMRKQTRQVSSCRTTRAKASHTTPVCTASSIEAGHEHDPGTVYKPRSVDRLQTTLIHNDKKELKTEPKLITWKVGGSYLHKAFEGNDLLPSHSQVPQFSVKEEKELLGVPEGFKSSGIRSFREFLADERNEQKNSPQHPPEEKTVYIDSVQHSYSDREVLDKETDEATPLDSSCQKLNHLIAAGERPKLPQDVNSERVDDSGEDKCVLQVFGATKTAGRNQRYQHIAKSNDKETCNDCHPWSPLPPPLPKSPSESWLIRTLPAVSSRRSSLGIRACPEVEASKTPSTDPKWETIVRTSNVHVGHLRFPEERLTSIPEA